MSVFRFQLQRVLELREEAVTRCERALEEARAAVRRLRALLDSERDAYLAEREELNARLRGADVRAVGLFEGSLDGKKDRMMRLLTDIRHAEEDVGLAEADLVQARRDLKVLDNLRQKRLTEFNEKEEEKERKFLDELALQRFARRQGQGM